MVPSLCRITGLFLLASMSVAHAAAGIPSSELPGRERQRFGASPTDRFTDPLWPSQTTPLLQWDCSGQAGKRSKNGKRKAVKNGC